MTLVFVGAWTTEPRPTILMLALCEDWATRCGVIPRETIFEEMKQLGRTAFREKDAGEET